MPDTQTLTYRRVVALHAALTVLANRRLPNISNDLRVAKLLTLVKPAAAEYEAARTKKVAEFTETGDDGEARIVRAVELQKALEEGLSQPVELPVFPFKLTQDDLPKPMKGENGDANSAGLGAIIADLVPELYDLPADG